MLVGGGRGRGWGTLDDGCGQEVGVARENSLGNLLVERTTPDSEAANLANQPGSLVIGP